MPAPSLFPSRGRTARSVLANLALIAVLLATVAAAEPPDSAPPIELKSRRELFVDHFLIASLSGVQLKLHEPRPMGPALAFDRPWEGVISGYASVFQDGNIYRMYYRGHSDPSYTIKALLRPGERVIPEHPFFACYAESRDGIVWTRPSLGLVEFNGSKDNNIIWNGSGAENFAPFRDDNPAAAAAERYKAVGAGVDGERKPVLLGFVSADGVHWRQLPGKPLITDGMFDSLNVVFWDAERGQYTAIYRDFIHGVRTIKYSSSSDFIHWPPGQVADFGDAPAEHLYTNGTVPYFRAPQIYLALPRRFIPWRTYFKHPETMPPGVSEGVFMSSRDGVHWNRFEEAFIRPGPDERNWGTRANTPVRGIVATGPGEMSIYVHRHNTFPTAYVERMVLRTDGFVSASAGSRGGELITKPLVFSGDNLVLNYSTAASGSIRIEIQDASGHALPGFALEDSPVIYGDKIEEAVAWTRGEDVARKPLTRLAGMPVRLRFVLRDADIYSLQFK